MMDLDDQYNWQSPVGFVDKANAVKLKNSLIEEFESTGKNLKLKVIKKTYFYVAAEYIDDDKHNNLTPSETEKMNWFSRGFFEGLEFI